MQLYWPTGPAARVLPWRTSVPARFWNSSATCSATWPAQVPSRSRVMNPPRRPSEQAWSSSVGSSATSASVKPGQLVGRELLEDAQVDEQPDDGFARPVVRAPQDARLEDPQRRRRTGRRGRSRAPGTATGAGRGHGLGHGDSPRMGGGAAAWASLRPPRRRAGRGAPATPPARGDAGRTGSPAGSEWRTTPLIISGRWPWISQASVSEVAPSTTVIEPAADHLHHVVRPDDARRCPRRRRGRAGSGSGRSG